MNANQLRAAQAPFKERYRADAATAQLTLTAEGRLGGEITCRLTTGKPGAPAGLHPAAGGGGTAACSAEMLLEALVGCAGVTLNAVATAMGIEIRNGVVRAEGDVDFRGTLGIARDVPVGFQRIRLQFQLETDASSEQLAKLVQLTERYCVVYQTLKQSPQVETTFGT